MTEKNNLNLEIYEFILNEYSDSPLSGPDNMFYSTRLDSISPENCGYIGKEEIPYTKKPVSDKYVRSCDSIDGTIKNMRTTVGDKPVLIIGDDDSKMNFKLNYITSNDLIKFTHVFNTKENIKDPSTNSIIEKNIPNMMPLYNVEQINNVLRNTKELLTTNRGNDNVNTHDYIKILRPIASEKMVIIGDIHGSHSSFIRILLRLRKLKVFDENCLFKGDYHLIFLGDVIDRGIYGFEIMMLIFMLKLLNPDKVHINNGNHEEININSRDGFKTQLLSIFGESVGSEIWKKFNDIFKLNHSAIMIENPNKKREYTYLAHGGFPIEEGDRSAAPMGRCISTIPSDFPLEFNEDVLNSSDKIFIPNVKINNNIRWTDFYGGEDCICNYTRAGGWVLGTKIIKKASKMGIKLTIRGHQDSKHNTKLIKKGDLYNKFININNIEPYNVSKTTNTVCYGYTHLIKLQENGNLNINNIDTDIFLPVVTVSTNTDLGRNLVRDSFSILKFIEEFNSDIQGCVDENSEDEKKIQENIKKLFSTKTSQHISSEIAPTTLVLTDIEPIPNEASLQPKLKLATLPPSPPPKKLKLNPNAAPFVSTKTAYLEKWKSKYLKYKSKYLELKSKVTIS